MPKGKDCWNFLQATLWLRAGKISIFSQARTIGEDDVSMSYICVGSQYQIIVSSP